MSSRPTVIFDLGGVLLQHDPTLAFAQALPPGDIATFMTEIGYRDWHHAHDAGRSFADGLAVLAQTHPQHVDAARALDVPVVVVRRPPAQATEAVDDVSAAQRWALAHVLR